ncbi:MAG: hypothetical protein AB7O68_16960 [Pirellulales bacterium]
MSTIALIAALSAFLSSGHVPSRSVHWFDQQIDVTPRVIDQSITADVARVHAAEQTRAGETRNLEQLEMHCTRSLLAAGLGQYAKACDIR